MISCPSGRGEVPTGYRTADVDLTLRVQTRAFRCACGEVHSWNEDAAWPEAPRSAAASTASRPELNSLAPTGLAVAS